MRGDWAEVSRLAHSAHPTPVRPDLVEGPVNTANPDPSSAVRPELVEGSVNTANPDPSSPIRPELVEGSVNTANPDPSSPIRPELVEGRPSSPFILRQAQDERTEGGDE